jgi:hypothetical protein
VIATPLDAVLAMAYWRCRVRTAEGRRVGGIRQRRHRRFAERVPRDRGHMLGCGHAHVRVILFGLYPYAEQWRAAIALAVVALDSSRRSRWARGECVSSPRCGLPSRSRSLR